MNFFSYILQVDCLPTVSQFYKMKEQLFNKLTTVMHLMHILSHMTTMTATAL